MREHWYKIHIDSCAICGATTETRERVYGKKPKDPAKRYVYTEHACYDHFL